MNQFQIAIAGYVPVSAYNCNDHISKLLESNKTNKEKTNYLNFYTTDQFKQHHLRYAAMMIKAYKGGSMRLLEHLVDRGLDPSDALDFSGSVKIAKQLMELGADPSESSFFSRLNSQDSVSGKGFRRRRVLLPVFTERIMNGGKLGWRVQDWYDGELTEKESETTVMGQLEGCVGIFLANACLAEYEKQCLKQNGCFYGLGYHFVERLYEYAKYAPLVMALKRVIGAGEGAGKRIKLGDKHPASRFLRVSAPVEVVQTIVSFLGFYPKLG